MTFLLVIPVFTHEVYQQLKCRFVKGSIKPSRQGGEWLIAAQIETDDIQAPTALETVKAIVTFGSNQSFSDLVLSIHDIIHHQLPAAYA